MENTLEINTYKPSEIKEGVIYKINFPLVVDSNQWCKDKQNINLSAITLNTDVEEEVQIIYIAKEATKKLNNFRIELIKQTKVNYGMMLNIYTTRVNKVDQNSKSYEVYE